MGISWNHQLTVLFRLELDWVELALLPERRAAHLLAANRSLLPLKARRVPDVEEHLDAANDHVGTPLHPSRTVARLHPDVLVHLALIVAANVVGSILEAHEVAWSRLVSARAGGATETLLRPAQGRHATCDAREDVNRMEGGLRIGGASLYTYIAARTIRLKALAIE